MGSLDQRCPSPTMPVPSSCIRTGDIVLALIFQRLNDFEVSAE